MVHKLLLLIHLVGFAAYLGAGFAQQRFMGRSAQSGVAAAVRDEYERLSAAVITRIELPSLFAQVATGVIFLVLAPVWLTQGWLHGKLACVLALLVLSHLEMFNARKIVRARAARGEAANAEIAERKARHRILGTVGGVAVVLVIGLVAYGTG
jgi:putative membrane protein